MLSKIVLISKLLEGTDVQMNLLGKLCHHMKVN